MELPTVLRGVAGVAATAAICAGLLACAAHPTRPVGFRGIVLGDRGITIPVPPPSLRAEPRQASRLEGHVLLEASVDAEEAVQSAEVHVVDLVSGVTADAELQAPAEDEHRLPFVVEGLVVDHTDNCLELWLEQGDDAMTEPVHYHTRILADDQSVEVVEGCIE